MKTMAKITQIRCNSCDLDIEVGKIEKLRHFLKKHTKGKITFTIREKE